jgi:nitroreductase
MLRRRPPDTLPRPRGRRDLLRRLRHPRRNIDGKEYIEAHGRDGRDAEDSDQQGQNYEGIRPEQGEADDPHAIGLWRRCVRGCILFVKHSCPGFNRSPAVLFEPLVLHFCVNTVYVQFLDVFHIKWQSKMRGFLVRCGDMYWPIELSASLVRESVICRPCWGVVLTPFIHPYPAGTPIFYESDAEFAPRPSGTPVTIDRLPTIPSSGSIERYRTVKSCFWYRDKRGVEMTTTFSREENRVLDDVIARRRSIRAFRPEPPAEGLIEQVILAGLQAPYAGLAAKEGVPYRLFRVVRQGPNMVRAQELIKEQAKASLQQMKEVTSRDSQGNDEAFAKRIESIAEHGIPTLKDAPFLIVVAERRGVPPVEFESLAHCLENMWLKATALGLGFQLLSVTKMLSQNRPFFDLVDLEFGQFLLNGCALGYPKHSPAEKHLFPLGEVVRWL